MTTGTYNFVSINSNVADVAYKFTSGFKFETYTAFNSVAAIASLLALLNITQFFDQAKISSVSQLINGIFNDLRKLLNCLNDTANLLLFLFT